MKDKERAGQAAKKEARKLAVRVGGREGRKWLGMEELGARRQGRTLLHWGEVLRCCTLLHPNPSRAAKSEHCINCSNDVIFAR